MPETLHRGQKRYLLDRLEMPDLEALPKKMRRKIMYNAAKIVALKARQIVPESGRRHKRRLSKSIKYRAFANGLQSQAYSRSPHAHLVHDGTAAHGISARSKETARSGWRYYRNSTRTVVHHPGAKAQPFFIEARDQTQAQVEAQMRQDMQDAADAIAAGETA